MPTRSGTAVKLACGAVMCTVLTGSTALACMDYRPQPAGLVRDVLSDDAAVAKAAVEKLRGMGPDGLGVLMTVYERDIRRHTGRGRVAYPPFEPRAFEAAFQPDEAIVAGRGLHPQKALPAASASATAEARWKRLAASIDAVAAQKDAAYSGLYWHTDIEKAKAAARSSGRPILSLRLLGTLDTEFSCANSRFFRTVLYANDEVSAALRDRFVLHWASVRPVPKVTIDMGDGRVVERTITGNSVHYVLDAEGRPVDAVPGLYGPKAFLRAITDAEQVARALGQAPDEETRLVRLEDWHAGRAQRITAEWEKDLASVGSTSERVTVQTIGPAKGARRGNPTAVEAAGAAVGKTAVEFNIVRALAPRVAKLRESTTDEAWAQIAALPHHAEDARLDGSSRLLVRAKHPRAADAGRLSMAKRKAEDPLLPVVENLQRSVSEDTVRNEYGFHRIVHEWFANRLPETRGADVGPLNEKVYAELFLTPSSDPWLGLVPADAYSALEGDGVRAAVE